MSEQGGGGGVVSVAGKAAVAALALVVIIPMVVMMALSGNGDLDDQCAGADTGSYGMGVDGPGGAHLAGLNAAQLTVARNTAAIGRQRGEPDSVILANLVAEATESTYRNLGNSNVPESLQYPHDGVGTDNDSVGPNQLRASVWAKTVGGMAQLMNPSVQANWFYDQADKVPGGKTMTPADLAQKVEVSGPNAYAGQMQLAQAVFNAVIPTVSSAPAAGAPSGADDAAATDAAAPVPSAAAPAAANAPATDAGVANPLQAAADQAVTDGHGKGLKVAIALADPTSGGGQPFYGGDAAGAMPSASLIKLGVAVAAAKAIDDKKVQQSDVENLMQPMIVMSDNDATNALVTKLGGLDYVNSTVQGLGVAGADYTMGRTVGENGGGADPNQMSVRGAQQLLQLIYDSAISGNGKLSAGAAGLIMNDLKAQNSAGANQKWDTVIPRPNLAHKTGELPGSGTSHEAGFIFDAASNKWLEAVIMTTGGTDGSLAVNNTVINAFGKAAYANLKSQVPGNSGASPAAAAACANNSGLTVVGGSAAQQAVVNAALKWVGTTYAWGGGNWDGPTKGIHDGGVADSYGDYNKVGFDCSGLVLYAYAQGAGIKFPGHYTGIEYTQTANHLVGGAALTPAQMQPGDLIFYGSSGADSHHVAIYAGDGKIVEAPESGSNVRVRPWTRSDQVAVTRPLGGMPGQQSSVANDAAAQAN